MGRPVRVRRARRPFASRAGRAQLCEARGGHRPAPRPLSVPGARAAGVPDLEIVVDSALLATVERKSLADLATSLTTGRLRYQLTDLAAVPRAAVVVEDRYSEVFKLRHVRPAVVADGIAECQVRWPTVPIVFAETRKLAQEWTYRFLAAARVALAEDHVGGEAVRRLVTAPALELPPPSPAEVRAWAIARGLRISEKGRVPTSVMQQFLAASSEEELS